MCPAISQLVLRNNGALLHQSVSRARKPQRHSAQQAAFAAGQAGFHPALQQSVLHA